MATALLFSSCSRRVGVQVFARSASTMADKPIAAALQDVLSRMKQATERANRTHPVSAESTGFGASCHSHAAASMFFHNTTVYVTSNQIIGVGGPVIEPPPTCSRFGWWR